MKRTCHVFFPLQAKYDRPGGRFRGAIFDWTTSSVFENLMMAVIGANAVVLMLVHADQGPE
jgi:hypothetical protein